MCFVSQLVIVKKIAKDSLTASWPDVSTEQHLHTVDYVNSCAISTEADELLLYDDVVLLEISRVWLDTLLDVIELLPKEVVSKEVC